MTRSAEMTHWLKCLPAKLGDLKLIPKSYKRVERGMEAGTYNSSAEEAETGRRLGLTDQPF